MIVMGKNKTTQPRKQRKRRYSAPLHQRNRRMTARLSNDLKEKYDVKRLSVRKGDKVKVFRGKRPEEDISGKVIRVLPQEYAIHVEGHSKEKADGTIVSFPISPSNVIITTLNLRDKKRKEIIKRRSKKDISDEEFESIFEEEEEYEEIEEEEEFDDIDDAFDDFEEDFEDFDVEEEDN